MFQGADRYLGTENPREKPLTRKQCKPHHDVHTLRETARWGPVLEGKQIGGAEYRGFLCRQTQLEKEDGDSLGKALQSWAERDGTLPGGKSLCWLLAGGPHRMPLPQRSSMNSVLTNMGLHLTAGSTLAQKLVSFLSRLERTVEDEE